MDAFSIICLKCLNSASGAEFVGHLFVGECFFKMQTSHLVKDESQNSQDVGSFRALRHSLSKHDSTMIVVSTLDAHYLIRRIRSLSSFAPTK